jgi:hypothetical protein
LALVDFFAIQRHYPHLQWGCQGLGFGWVCVLNSNTDQCVRKHVHVNGATLHQKKSQMKVNFTVIN